MTLRKCLLIMTASAFAAPAFAAPPTLAVNSPSAAQNLAQGSASDIVVTFTNSTAPNATAAGFQFRLAYNNAAIAFPSLAAPNVVSAPAGIVCNQFNATTLSCGGFSGAGDFPASVTVTIRPQTLAGPSSSPLTMTNFLAFDGNGDGIAGATAGAAGTYTVTGGAVNTPPTIGYNPAIGSTINYTGGGTATAIVATPSGGAGSGAAATTTVGACTISGGGAAFPTTNIAQLSFVGNTVAPQNINLPNCVPQALATNATLTCPETQGAGAAVNRVFTLNCPAAAAVNTPPTIGYNPAIGSTINYTGGGTATAIVATPSAGAGSGAAATTTVGACAITGGGAAFPTTNIAQLSFVGNTVAPQNINLPNCVPQGAAVNATLTCPETRGAAAAVNRVWTLTCPAAAVVNTPPALTYNPVAGSTTNVAAGANTVISVGCPSDGGNCGGTGTGAAATSRLEGLTATFTGAASPQPTMVCNFITEGGVVLGGSTLDFVATQADPGDIRCTCPINTTSLPEPFRVSVNERIPASGGVTATRTFDLVCGAPPPNCGNIVAANQSPGSIVALTNGGAATQVTALSLVGASSGVSQTTTCVVSGASANSTFTVTTAPTPLVLSTIPGLSGTVSATCTNTATTTATATVTCSFASNNAAVCANGNPVQFTLSCPGAGGPPPPPPVNFIPVPTMTEQGRILLAALVLLMGLGVVGFRMRG